MASTLPTREEYLTSLKPTTSAAPKDEICGICREDFSPERPLTSTPCSHAFCLDCHRSSVEYSNLCPMCRRPLHELDIPTTPLGSSTEASDLSAWLRVPFGAGHMWIAPDRSSMEFVSPPSDESFAASEIQMASLLTHSQVRVAYEWLFVFAIERFLTRLTCVQGSLPQLENGINEAWRVVARAIHNGRERLEAMQVTTGGQLYDMIMGCVREFLGTEGERERLLRSATQEESEAWLRTAVWEVVAEGMMVRVYGEETMLGMDQA